MLETEFKYYIDHQQELVDKFNGRFIVIKDQNVIGDYDRHDTAYFEAQKQNKLGTFLIQLCSPGNMAYTANFYSQNVSF